MPEGTEASRLSMVLAESVLLDLVHSQAGGFDLIYIAVTIPRRTSAKPCK
jgi:hypothetical protein